MAYKLKKTVVLVGMMGAGKTAVGTALSRKLGVGFSDSDTELEIAANMSIGEIFKRDGEVFFRKRETEVLARLLRKTPRILSIGGGAFLSPENRMAISKSALSLWLRADVDLLWSRVRLKNTRPLLQTDNPRETLQKLAEIRDKSYKLADLTVMSDVEFSIDDMADRVTHALLGHMQVLERL